MAVPQVDLAHLGTASNGGVTAPVVGTESGLSVTQAAQRLAADDANALAGGKRRSLLSIAVETVREPMFLLLLAAGTIYLVFGDLQEGLTLFGFLAVTVALTLYRPDLPLPRFRRAPVRPGSRRSRTWWSRPAASGSRPAC